MLDPVIQSGAVGSYYPANSPARANLGGYAVTTSEITGTGSVHGIETQTHTFTVAPLENPIQAKLLDQKSGWPAWKINEWNEFHLAAIVEGKSQLKVGHQDIWVVPVERV